MVVRKRALHLAAARESARDSSRAAAKESVKDSSRAAAKDLVRERAKDSSS